MTTRPSNPWFPGMRVVAVVNRKGGVGKTTIANNLAVYARTVDPSLPVLVLGLDDSPGPDAMFALDGAAVDENSDTALRRGCFEQAIRPGRYGVYYVPSSPRMAALMREMVDPFQLGRALQRTAFPGLVIIDTRSDFGILTRSAIAASDLAVVPVADLESLVTAKEVFELLALLGRPRAHARVVLSMLDLRIKYQAELCGDVLGLLVASARRLGFPLFQSFIARSPRVQALATNPAGRTSSVLNDANRTAVHHQMGELAEEVLEELESRRSVERDGLAADMASESSPSLEPREEPVAWLHPCTPEAAFALQQAGGDSSPVGHFPFFIGRHNPDVLNDLAIPDRRPWQISRRHAHLIRREGRVGVMDLGSTRGTWVDGHPLGGPTADPGPVYFGAKGGVLTLGKRGSPYRFDVAVSRAALDPLRSEASPAPPVASAALAALVA